MAEWKSWTLQKGSASQEWWPDSRVSLKGWDGACLRGQGLSYSDIALPDGRGLITTERMNNWIHWDPERGILEVESGVLLADILRFAHPKGWMLPVVPGTALISVGGAIANDVHGKNQHTQGSFSRSVISLSVRRGNGELWEASREHNSGLWRATVGGVGGTGLIVTAKLKLQRGTGSWVRVRQRRFHGWDEFEEMAKQATAEHVVGWVDIGGRAARGIFMEAKPEPAAIAVPLLESERRNFPPGKWVNPISVKLMNGWYWGRHPEMDSRLEKLDQFLFPLDQWKGWNTMYGVGGFAQHQSVLPLETSKDALNEMLRRCAKANAHSFLSVIKLLKVPGEGVLSFARPGVTFAMDFMRRGDETKRLMEDLQEIALSAGGRMYLAKNDGISWTALTRSYPQWKEWWDWRDEACWGSKRLMDWKQRIES